MYCINCGKKSEGGQFCMSCGKKLVPPVYNQTQNPYNSSQSTAAVTTMQHTSNKAVLGIIGAAVIVLILVIVLTRGISRAQQPAQYYSNPYNNSQGFIVPPADFSNGFSYDNSYDSYNSGNTSQLCPSCRGSGICPICHGTGRYSMYGNALSDCTACDGSGECSVCD